MTISGAIAAADELRPNNDISTATKLFWLNEVETRVKEVAEGRILADGEDYAHEALTPETDQNAELMAPEGYASIYPKYIVAMIDYSHNEPAVYANSSHAFETAFSQFAAWFVREHRQAQDHKLIMY